MVFVIESSPEDHVQFSCSFLILKTFYIPGKLSYKQNGTRTGEKSPKENEYIVRLFQGLFPYMLILTRKTGMPLLNSNFE